MIKAAFLAFGGQLRTTNAEDFHERERGGGGEREREGRERLASSSAHADIKETFKQKSNKLDKNMAITASFLPFSKNAIVDKSAYKVENLFLVNFDPQRTSGMTLINQLPKNIIKSVIRVLIPCV